MSTLVQRALASTRAAKAAREADELERELSRIADAVRESNDLLAQLRVWLAMSLGADGERLGGGHNRTVGADTARIVYVGLARDIGSDRGIGPPSYPDIAESMRRASHSGAHGLHGRWQAWPETVRLAWRGEFEKWAKQRGTAR